MGLCLCCLWLGDQGRGDMECVGVLSLLLPTSARSAPLLIVFLTLHSQFHLKNEFMTFKIWKPLDDQGSCAMTLWTHKVSTKWVCGHINLEKTCRHIRLFVTLTLCVAIRHTGKWVTTGSLQVSRGTTWFVMFAGSCGVNSPNMANFKLLMWSLWMQRFKREANNNSRGWL